MTKVIRKTLFSQGTFLLEIQRPSGFSFRCGQHVTLGLANWGINREYSIYSGENESQLTFLIKVIDNGILSKGLFELKSGDPLELTGPFGEFSIDAALPSPVTFFATGTGIAPFHSFIQSRPELDYHLVWGVRHLAEAVGHEEYGGRVTLCLSGEPLPQVAGEAGCAFFSGRITQWLEEHSLQKNSSSFLCGNRNMINEVYNLLRSKQLSSDQIKTEVFF